MKKILHLYDTWILRLGISFLIVFTALYPKLPSIQIIRTWVYIRLEDFVIAALTLIWLIQLLRRKVSVPPVLAIPILIFWLVGLISSIHSLIFIGPALEGYFPHIVILNYLRRIEYMILFFIAFSSVKSIKTIRGYSIIIALTAFGVVLYGFGQRYYLDLWSRFPDFFQKFPFCFPSFQTGNEEFAKGIPLCLQQGARLTSTFGGHYDLAAYLVLVIPIIFSIALIIKKIKIRLLFFLLSLASLILLIFTSSRVSFISYITAIIFTLILAKKKLYIFPVIFISIILLLVFSEATARRLASTIRLGTVVTNLQGQLVGEAPINLPQSLKNKISSDQAVEKPQSSKTLPLGSGFIGLPQQSDHIATNMAVIKKPLSQEETKRLNLESGSLKLSTVSGNFIIRKVLLYDISFTTRFQGEWPNAWKAFLRNPLLGSGYSTITLATDNDYFRALGETGILGLISFLFIFFMYGVILRETIPQINQPLVRSFAFGAAGGAFGLLLNAVLIDVFEASKVAENLWTFLGIAAAGLFLYKKKPISYPALLKKIFTSTLSNIFYLSAFLMAAFLGSINNFFVADDFKLLRQGAALSTNESLEVFTNAGGMLYSPLPKFIIFVLYTLLSFQPQGYHTFVLFIHLLSAIGIYFISKIIFKKKLLAFFASLVFIINPLTAENIYWLSSMPATLASLFSLYSTLLFLKFRQKKSGLYFLAAAIFTVLALLSHPLAILIPVLVLAIDLILYRNKSNLIRITTLLTFVSLVIIYFAVLNQANAIFSLKIQNIYYLAAAFLSITLIYILNLGIRIISKKFKISSSLLLSIITLILLLILNTNMQSRNRDWQGAGNIAKNILTDLKVSYDDLNNSANFYFINVPREYNTAHVLCTGLKDALWFIYQNNSPAVHQVDSYSEAVKQINTNQTKENHIFNIEKDGRLQEVR
jgi:hypothetical protein